jgi:hypothetical protein
MINVLSSLLTISMLVLKNYLKVKWTNTLFNEELKREKMNVPYVEFCVLEG